MSGTTLEQNQARPRRTQLRYATEVTTTGGAEPPIVAASSSEAFVDREPRLAGFTIRGSTSAWQKDVWCLLIHARNLLVHLPDLELPDEQPGYLEDLTATEVPWAEFMKATLSTVIVTHPDTDRLHAPDTVSPASSAYEPVRPVRTKLGRRLRQIRQRIKASGQPLLDWNGIDRELRERRGEYDPKETP